MAVEKVFGELICKCERCNGGAWKSKDKKKLPASCPHCRSQLWNKKKQEIKAVKEGEIPQVALICAIVQKFSCIYFEDKNPCTPVCKMCFALPVWNDKDKIEGLLEAFDFVPEVMDEPEDEGIYNVSKSGNIIPGTKDREIIPSFKGINGDRVIETKTPEQIMSEMEAREIKEPTFDLLRDGELPPVSGGNSGIKKKDEKLVYTAAARTCEKKELDAQGQWTCNFFTIKSKNPPFPYCTLCWELPEIWAERAVGQK